MLTSAEYDLQSIKSSNRQDMAGHFAAALAKLEGSGGAIVKIKAAQAYAHDLINQAQQSAYLKVNPTLQKRIGAANVYVERLDKHIETIEKELILFLTEKKNKCMSDTKFQPKDYIQAAMKAAALLKNLVSFVRKDIMLGINIFDLEKKVMKRKPFWQFWN